MYFKLQVYFGKTTDVTGVVISGGGANWDLGSWVTSFTLAFSMDGASWAPYKGHSNSVQVRIGAPEGVLNLCWLG